MIYKIENRRVIPLTRTYSPRIGARSPHLATIDVHGWPDRVVEIGYFDTFEAAKQALRLYQCECFEVQAAFDAAAAAVDLKSEV